MGPGSSTPGSSVLDLAYLQVQLHMYRTVLWHFYKCN